MKISTLYDIPCRIKNKNVSDIVYKVNKVILNAFYPRTIKNEYALDSTSKIIVSLTSFPERIDTVWITVQTLMHQTRKPYQILLWLAQEQFPNGENDLPDNLLNLRKYGLSIKFCDNLYPHKKYFYTMQEYPEYTVVTVDDDVLYPEYLLEKLESTSQKYPHTICCTWAHEITLSNGKINDYDGWNHGIETDYEPSLKLMPVGCGAVLYPPHCLYEDVFNKERIKQLCLMTDDLWLKAMAIMKHIPSVRIPQKARIYMTIIKTQTVGLHYNNVGNKKNDISLRNILKEYSDIERILESEDNNEESKHYNTVL